MRRRGCNQAVFLPSLQPAGANGLRTTVGSDHIDVMPFERGVIAVPLNPEQAWAAPESGAWVINPAVSMASLDSGRYRMDDSDQRRLAIEHLCRLQAAGRVVMVQPYLAAIEDAGETALVYLCGIFSHAVRKGAGFMGPDRGIDRRFQPQGGLNLEVCRPTAAQFAMAERMLAAVPAGRDTLLYARVDLIPSEDGSPTLMELELTEPQLYFGHQPGAADRMASAVAAQARAHRSARAIGIHKPRQFPVSTRREGETHHET